MAEFLTPQNMKNKVIPAPSPTGDSGFDAMGKPMPLHRCTVALHHCRDMGLTNTEQAMACVSGMAAQLARDEPYEALAVGMRYLDITGCYRLIAVLLTAELKE
jgi:hypothetical protein